MENTYIGTFITNVRGFGFVAVEGAKEDYFISEDDTGGAFDGDKVRILVSGVRRGLRPEAKVVEILERAVTKVVGIWQQKRSYGFVTPDNPRIPFDIYVPKEESNGAVEGAKVVVKITDYGHGNRNPEGKVIEILGHVNEPGVDILSIVRAYDLPEGFSEKVQNQAQRVAKEVTDADRAGRRDLRDMLMVTIDGEDAKDLDDAVSLVREGTLFHLGVHIADVANYVQENSALDWEARKRGTSVYLTDRVIPMLPHTLSNGICSLNAGQDRLALSCLMDVDQTGVIVNYELVESVIRVDRRMSYPEVKRLLSEPKAETASDYGPILPMLEHMRELSALLRARRRERGAVDFEFPESKILLDPEGNPLAIQPYERNVATKLIEDFMLAANETVAQHFYWLETPFVYRIHDKPDREKMERLGLFLHNFGYHIRLGRGNEKAGSQIHPKELQKLLDHVEGTPEEALIARLTLRSMKRAAYGVDCTGHFGLAASYYCHFTSPIRRYPDLQIHRIIKEFLRGKLNQERIEHYRARLPEVAKESSVAERRAQEAERETDKLKKAQFMAERVGEVYTGVVSGVTGWGLYVELPNTVEGRVHVDSLEADSWIFNPERYELTGKRTGICYKLGQRLTIQVQNADTFTRSIDFVLYKECEDDEGNTEAGSEQ